MIKTILILFICSYSFSLKAQTITQEVIANDGGYHKQINGSVQFTIGEPISESYKADSSYLTQGFQQGNYNIVAVNEIKVNNVNLIAFPNPTDDVLNLKVSDETNSEYNLLIIDMQGKTLNTLDFKSNTNQSVLLSDYANASYFIQVKGKNSNYSKTLKINKISK